MPISKKLVPVNIKLILCFLMLTTTPKKPRNYKKKCRSFMLVFLCFMAGSHCIIKSKLTSQIPDRDISNEENFNAMSIYLFPNCFLPLIFGYFVDYLGENLMIMSFLINITLAFTIQSLSLFLNLENFNQTAEFSYVSSFLFAISGESFKIPIFTCIKKWYKQRVTSHKFNVLCSSISLGKAIKIVLVTLLFQLESQSDGASTSSVFYRFQQKIFIILLIVIVISIVIGCFSIHNNQRLQKLEDVAEDIPGFMRSLRKIINKQFTLISIGSGLLHASCYLYFDFHYATTDNIVYVRTFYYMLTIVLGGSFLLGLLFVGKHIDRYGSPTSLLFLSCFFFMIGYCCMSILTSPSRSFSTQPVVVLLIITQIFNSFGYALHYGSVFSVVPCVSNNLNAGISFGYLISLQNLVSTCCIWIAETLCQKSGFYKLSFSNIGFNIYYFCLALSFSAFLFFLVVEVMDHAAGADRLFYKSPREKDRNLRLYNSINNTIS